MSFTKTSWKVLGSRGTALLLLGSLGGILLSSVDLGFTLLLHSLFHELGIQEPSRSKSIGAVSLSAPVLVAALIGVGLARNLGSFMVNNAAATAHKLASTRLRLIRFHLSLEKNASAPLSPTDIQHSIHEVYPKTALFYRQAALCTGKGLYALGLLAVMAYHAPWLSLAALIGLALFGPLVAKGRYRITQSARKIPLAHKELMRGIEHVSQNWLFLRVMRLLKTERSRLVEHTLSLNNEALRVVRLSLLSNAVVSIVGLLLLIGLLFTSLHLNLTPGITTVAFVYLFMRLIQTLSGIASSLSTLISVKPQFKRCASDLSELTNSDVRRAISVMHAKPEPGNSPDSLLSASAPPPLPPPPVNLSGLSFSFSASDDPLFENLSLDLSPGDTCAIVGPSGAGKTSLLSLVAGLLTPTAGEVLVGEVPPKDFFASGACRVGFVGPAPYLIAGTIRENLCLGFRWSPPDEAIKKALSAAHFNHKIEALSDGLDHKLLSGGEGLSSGEKQRLCLARALLGQPNILLLDEMSANLDQKTEKDLVETLRNLKGHCTILLSTHRANFLSLADKIITLPRQLRPPAERGSS